MRILHCVESYFPAENGMAEQVRKISERISERGHSVTVATSTCYENVATKINGVNIVRFNISGNLVFGMEGDIESYRQFLLNEHFDIIVFFAAQQWATDAAFDVLTQINAQKVFVPVGFSGLDNIHYSSYFKQLPDIMRKFDAHVFLSDTYQDIAFARKNSIENLIVIPNAADEGEFGIARERDTLSSLNIKTKKTILLVGNHTGVKGHQDAMNIFHKAAISDATLCIVGREEKQEQRSVRNFLRNVVYHKSLCLWGPGCNHNCHSLACRMNNSNVFKRQKKQIVITELSRTELVSLYKQADLLLFPSNVECSPIVLFEAAASGTPFLATDVGNSSEIVEWTGGGKILPTKKWRKGLKRADITLSSKMLEECINDSEWLNSASQSAQKVWHERFTWEHVAQRYLELYKSL